MPTHRTALSALATTALLSSGLALGTATPAEAAPVQPAPVVRSEDKGLGDLLQVITAPLLSTLGQVPGVGIPIKAIEPVLTNVLGLLNLDIEWFCDDKPIVGTKSVWTYIPGPAQEGCKITAKVIATVLGFLPLEMVTNAIEVPLSNIPGLPGQAKAPVATKAVAIPTTAKVGTPLAATAPTWDTNATDVVTTYQWLRAGQPIAGATAATYTPTADDLGKALTVRATGTRDKAPSVGTSESAAVTVAQGDAPTATALPAVVGNPAVGQVLSVSAPTWSGTTATVPAPTNSYQWLRDGQAIAGATAATYTVTEADAGRALSVRVTGKRAGYADGTATTAPVTVVAEDKPLTPVQEPSISGLPEVGRTLTASPGSWTAPEADYTFTWMRDGQPIATGQQYVVQVADIGSRLTVAVVATAAGYAEGTASAATPAPVARLSSTTSATLSTKRVQQGRKAKITIILRAAGASRTGQVRIYDGQRVLKTLSVAGQRTVKLPKLGVGKHRIRVSYVGSKTTAPSSSKVLTLNVVKKAKKK